MRFVGPNQTIGPQWGVLQSVVPPAWWFPNVSCYREVLQAGLSATNGLKSEAQQCGAVCTDIAGCFFQSLTSGGRHRPAGGAPGQGLPQPPTLVCGGGDPTSKRSLAPGVPAQCRGIRRMKISTRGWGAVLLLRRLLEVCGGVETRLCIGHPSGQTAGHRHTGPLAHWGGSGHYFMKVHC